MAETPDHPQEEAAGPRPTLLSVCLAGTAGFADAFGYISLHGLLTAHVTGNLAFMAVGIAEGSPRVIMKFLALPLFALGVGLATLLLTKISRDPATALPRALALEVALFGLCGLAGTILPPSRSPDDLTCICLGTLLLLTMASQNALMRIALPKLPSTTAMTVNVSEAMVRWMTGVMAARGTWPAGDRQALLGRAKMIGTTVCAFAVGAVTGALAALKLGGPGLFLPACLVGLLAASAARRSRNANL